MIANKPKSQKRSKKYCGRCARAEPRPESPLNTKKGKAYYCPLFKGTFVDFNNFCDKVLLTSSEIETKKVAT